MKEKVAIIGMGCVFPGAMDFTEYWQNIVEGKNLKHSVFKNAAWIIGCKIVRLLRVNDEKRENSSHWCVVIE